MYFLGVEVLGSRVQEAGTTKSKRDLGELQLQRILPLFQEVNHIHDDNGEQNTKKK